MAAQSFTISERRDGIGASEVGAILGVSRFRSPLDVAYEKKGLVDPSTPGNLAIRGSELEDVVARRVEKDQEVKLRRSTKKYRHKEIPHLYMHLDRLIVGQPQMCEIKTTNPHTYANSYLDSEHGMPDYIWYQLQAQFACKPDVEKTLLAICIVENWEFHYKWIYPHQPTIDYIVTEVDDFWKRCVLGDEMPRHLGLDDLRTINPTQEVLLADVDLEDSVRRLTEIQQCKKALESEEKEIQASLAERMLDYTEVQGYDGKWLARFKPRKSSRFDSKSFKAHDPETYSKFVKESESRTLTVNYKIFEEFVSNENPQLPATDSEVSSLISDYS